MSDGCGGGRIGVQSWWSSEAGGLGVGKSRGDTEGAFTRQGATATVRDPLGYAIGHKLLDAGQQFSSGGRRRGSTRHRYAGTWRPA